MKLVLRAFVPLFFIGLFNSGCSSSNQEEPVNQIILENTSDIKLTSKPIIVPRDLLSYTEGDGYPLLTSSNGDTLTLQQEDIDGDGFWDELFFVADFLENETKTFNLTWIGEMLDFPKQTSVRFGKRDTDSTAVYSKLSDTLFSNQISGKLGYQPYQTDGPSFENDKIGFRHYFDGRHAKDLYGKKSSAMSPESVGLDEQGGVFDNFHVMADWGRDVLSVNNSTGLGGLALKLNDEYGRLGCVAGDTITNIDYSVFEIIFEGPVHSKIRFTHHGWHPFNSREYNLIEEVDIWPGFYGFHGKAWIEGIQGDESLLVGLVNSNTEEPVTELTDNEKYNLLFTHDKQTYDKTWWLGLAVMVPKDAYKGYGEAPEEGKYATNYYAELSVENNEPIEYYGLGAWELSDENFIDSTYFVHFIQNIADQTSAEIKVTVN